MNRFAIAGALLLGTAGTAFAQAKFEDVSAKATPVKDGAALGALFWAATVDCSKAEDDLQRRQCEGVRDARGSAAAGGLYIMDADGAFVVGEWDDAKKGIPLAVKGCLACGTPVEVSGTGDRRFVVTKGGVSIKGGAVVGPDIHKATRVFRDKGRADGWKNIVAPRLRTQLVFKLPAKPDAWSEEGAKGYTAELVGFRVYDPCDGAMVCANPPSSNLAADKAACKGGMPSGTDIEGVEDKPKPPPVEDKPKEPELPDSLSNYQIKQAMQATAVPGINACYATYGVPGTANLKIEILNDGSVKDVDLGTSDFADTPTGDCIVKAIKKTAFPKFKRASMNIPWPVVLR
jgi:hypothetical protein